MGNATIIGGAVVMIVVWGNMKALIKVEEPVVCVTVASVFIVRVTVEAGSIAITFSEIVLGWLKTCVQIGLPFVYQIENDLYN
jgi:hypothetical protein